MRRVAVSLGRHAGAVTRTFRSFDRRHVAERLWAKDASLWTSDPAVQRTIKNRLGWLTLTEVMGGRIAELTTFARSVKAAGFTHVVLLGMGGSSLCPEVLRMTFGVTPGFPDLQVLDSTDPATIRRLEGAINLRRTLFLLASKSGTTIEVQLLYRYFADRVRAITGHGAGRQCVAITDPGTPLEDLARDDTFLRVFLNPADLGGRYSALSYFGLVPAALIGVDLQAFLGRADEMVQATAPCVPAADNPGIRLGAMLGALAKAGRNKVSVMTVPAIKGFGAWVEQLVAESTGKEGQGLVPIDGEALGGPHCYGRDRVFIAIGPTSPRSRGVERKLTALARAGHPVIRLHLRDPLDLAGEFFRWEIATAVAGALLRINPFDEPNVAESKKNTERLLRKFCATGHISSPKPLLEADGIRVYGTVTPGRHGSLRQVLEAFLDRARPSDYLALMAYVERSQAHEALLQTLRHWIRDRYRIATTLGYGPRYLHSTGQLHKGGAGNGLFIQITADEHEDLPIPGAAYTFGVLKQAQALGDVQVLRHKGRRILQIHLGRDAGRHLRMLLRRLGISRTGEGARWN